MSVGPPLVIVEPFGSGASSPYITLPILVPSQVPVSPEMASFTDGFPPATMTDPTSGGIPPDGADMNGILYMISAYCAWAQGGGQFSFDSDFVAANTGYAVGAVLQSAVTPSRFYLNSLANNANNPDSVLTGWTPYSLIASPTGVQTTVLAAGATNNLALTAGTGFLDLSPTSGAADVTGIAAGTDGQLLVVTNIHASNSVTLDALNAGSVAANRLRLPADLTILQYSNITLRYSTSLALWIPA